MFGNFKTNHSTFVVEIGWMFVSVVNFLKNALGWAKGSNDEKWKSASEFSRSAPNTTYGRYTQYRWQAGGMPRAETQAKKPNKSLGEVHEVAMYRRFGGAPCKASARNFMKSALSLRGWMLKPSCEVTEIANKEKYIEILRKPKNDPRMEERHFLVQNMAKTLWILQAHRVSDLPMRLALGGGL